MLDNNLIFDYFYNSLYNTKLMILRAFFIFCCLTLCTFTSAQDQQQVAVQEGAIFTIGNPSSAKYRHINFPRKNFIIKRGGIANMKALKGKKVEVVRYAYTSDGRTEVTLKPLDGGKFFRHFPTVKAHLEDALRLGELRQ